MIFECPNGHENYYTMDYWRRHKECPTCKNNQYYKMDDTAPKKNGYRILAFDQASITSGWAVFDDEKLIKFGHWTSDGEHSTERIAKTKYWFSNMIQVWNPDLVVLEDIQLQEFGGDAAVTTYKKLAHLQGVLKNYCYENGILYKIVPPATWRSFNQIKGKSRTDLKRNAQFKIKQLYDVKATQDDSDAILIGTWAAHESNMNKVIIF